MPIDVKAALRNIRNKVRSELRENLGVGERGLGDLGRFGRNVVRNPVQELRSQGGAAVRHGVFPAVTGVASLAKPLVKSVSPRAGRILEENIAEAKRQGGMAYTVGQQLPTLAIPAARLPKVIAAAPPVTRLLGASAIRGLEGAATQLPVDITNEDLRTAVRNIPRNVAFGAAGNVILSPRLTGKAVRQVRDDISQTAVRDARGKVVALPGSAKVPGGIDPNEALKAEARKYKSAEEFVNSKVNAYHQTNEKFDAFKDSDTTFFKTDKLKLSTYGKNTIDAFVDSKKPYDKGAFYYNESEWKSLLPRLKKQGYDSVVLRGKPGDPTAIREIVSLDSKNIKTKSQLTDIYNEATRQTARVTEPGLQKIKPTVKVKSQVKLPSEQSGSIPPTPPKSPSISSLSNIPESTPVGKKVNLLDQYLRTPDRVMKKIGLEGEMRQLRRSYDSYKQELPAEIARLQEWQKRVTPEGNVRIFKALDGQLPVNSLPANEQQVANEIRDYLKVWADRLDLPKDSRITNYITHIFEKDFIQKEFPDEIANLISDKVAGSVYDPFVQKRLGKLGYVEDTFRALEAYVKRATRKANLDPALETIKKRSDLLEQSQFKYVKNYIDRINLRPTDIDNLLDNTLKQVFGYRFGVRPTAQGTRIARQIGYRGGLGLNVGTALKNLSQGANTYAKLGEKYTVIGYTNALKNLATGSDELVRVGVLNDDIIQDKVLSVGKQFLQRFDKTLFAMFETAEKINRGAAYYGAKAKGLAQGMSEGEAIDFAKKVVRDTQFTFGSIDTPPILQSDIAKLFGQFQSFTIKQGEFLGEMIAAKDLAGLVRWSLASLLFVHTAGKAIGMEDKDLIPTFRIGAPPALKLPVDLTKLALGGTDKYGNPLNLKKILKQDTPILIPAGSQLKKTYEGLKTATQGYSSTDTGDVRYPVEPTVGNKIKGGLFGQYSFPEARQYFNEGRRPLGKEQSEIFKAGAGVDFYNKVIQDRQTKKESDKEVKSLQSGKKSTAQDLGNGLFQLSSGEVYSKTLDKKYDTPEEANTDLKKEELKKSGKSILIDGDTVYRLSKTGTVTTTTKLDYDFSLNTVKMDTAKAKNDFKTWAELADTNFRNLQIQLKDPTLDELEQLEIQKKMRKLAEDYSKYKGYGGRFKIGKKGRRVKAPKTAIASVKATGRVVRPKGLPKAPKTRRLIVKRPRINYGQLASGR